MPTRLALMAAVAALAFLVEGCSDGRPLYGPTAFRDGTGVPVDPIYGTPLPGTLSAGGGGGGGSGGM